MKIKDYPEIYRKVKAIRNFAKEMGYTTDSYYYNTESLYNNDISRPAFYIELVETSDSDGYSYSWAWYMDTGEELY